MKWQNNNTLKWKLEKENKKKWHVWYAWYPATIKNSDGSRTKIWFENVLRKGIYDKVLGWRYLYKEYNPSIIVEQIIKSAKKYIPKDSEMFDMFIKDKKLTKNDIGSKVTYIPPHAQGNTFHPDCEHGTITTWNEKFVFVSYDKTLNQSKATRPQDLIWHKP